MSDAQSPHLENCPLKPWSLLSRVLRASLQLLGKHITALTAEYMEHKPLKLLSFQVIKPGSLLDV